MNILLIIGNGLDIAHHLKTSYQDFFKYYLGIPTDDADIAKMKRDIDKFRYETWADLEIGLGKYSAKCASKEVFLKCVADMKSNLREYLQGEVAKIQLYHPSSFERLYNFDLLLEPEPRARYQSFAQRYDSYNEVNVITLNYTPTLEVVTEFEDEAVQLGGSAELDSIVHVHGTLDDMMAMGVNDESQISNSSLSGDLDVVEEFIKPEFNDACMNNKNAECQTLIDEASVIVIYGSSVGPSDDKWWKYIGKRMNNDINYPLLIYIPFDSSKNLAAEPNHLRRWTRQYVSEIKEKFGITISEHELFPKVCVAINKRLIPLRKVAVATK